MSWNLPSFYSYEGICSLFPILIRALLMLSFAVSLSVHNSTNFRTTNFWFDESIATRKESYTSTLHSAPHTCDNYLIPGSLYSFTYIYVYISIYLYKWAANRRMVLKLTSTYDWITFRILCIFFCIWLFMLYTYMYFLYWKSIAYKKKWDMLTHSLCNLFHDRKPLFSLSFFFLSFCLHHFLYSLQEKSIFLGYYYYFYCTSTKLLLFCYRLLSGWLLVFFLKKRMKGLV